MRKRISPATVIPLVALFFALGGTSLAGTLSFPAHQMTSRFRFDAMPHRVETECEPTSARAVRLGGEDVRLPQLLTNRAHNGTVYVYERKHATCVSIVNWSAHRERVHFTITLIDTQTRAPGGYRVSSDTVIVTPVPTIS